MTKRFQVYLVTTASCVIEVEAEDGEAAVELALQEDLPYAPAFAGFDLGDWTTASELWPQHSKPEDDYDEFDD